MDLTAALRAFVRTIETGSMTAAARDLKLSQPAVSKLVRNLETHTQTKLLERNGRAVHPTEAGRRLYEGSGTALATIDGTLESIRSEQGNISGPLRLHCPVCLGERYLCGIVAAFQQDHPNVAVQLTLENQPPDLLKQNLDIAFRMGVLDDHSLIQTRIGLITRILVASPDYMDRAAPLTDVSSLRNHDTIVTDAVLSPSGILTLKRDRQTVDVPLDPILKTNNAHVLVEALRRGQGVGTAQTLLVSDDLAEGRLVRVLPDYEVAATPLHLTYLPTRHMRPAVRAFADFALQSLRSVDGIVQD
ncbi:LysR family transcriptional regulator [Methyloligella solikamskensis]|uniref:LysR family transcriptional regulator n=1 Tax=Methyloligella solikamskensis TaxID=1177756 RepID=A0ABW3JA07_9HYPH